MVSGESCGNDETISFVTCVSSDDDDVGSDVDDGDVDERAEDKIDCHTTSVRLTRTTRHCRGI